jgi:hypothetical protein
MNGERAAPRTSRLPILPTRVSKAASLHEPADHISDEREDDTQNDARHDGKIKLEVPFIDYDVSGQLAQVEKPAANHPDEADHDEDGAGCDEQLWNIHNSSPALVPLYGKMAANKRNGVAGAARKRSRATVLGLGVVDREDG